MKLDYAWKEEFVRLLGRILVGPNLLLHADICGALLDHVMKLEHDAALPSAHVSITQAEWVCPRCGKDSDASVSEAAGEVTCEHCHVRVKLVWPKIG